MEVHVPKSWWVNQGSKFKEESRYGYLFAPAFYPTPGRIRKVYELVSTLVPGDLLISNVNGYISAVIKVTDFAIIRSRPNNINDKEQGFFVKADYFFMENKLKYNVLPLDLRLSETKVFNKNGQSKQVYISGLSKSFVDSLFSLYPSYFPNFMQELIEGK